MLHTIHLADSVTRLAGNLSHGQKQWLEIGMLLMQDPKLLLLDEPVAGMTDEETARTAELFLTLKGKHSLMVVEHDMSFIRTISEIVTVLCDGSVLAQGTLDQVQADERVIEVYLGRWAVDMLDVKNINQYYGGSHILRDVSLEAQLGKVTVLLGRNGVGKTTLLKSLMGLVPIKTAASNSTARPSRAPRPTSARAPASAFVPQGREIFARLTVEENLRMGLAYKSASTPIPAELYELFPVLKQMLNRRGGDLSGGQQQQLAIARALAAKPQAADPGRAHRGHPAQHHQGHRPRDPHAGRPGRHGHPAGGAVLRLCRGTGRRLPGDGARRVHCPRPRQRDGRKRHPPARCNLKHVRVPACAPRACGQGVSGTPQPLRNTPSICSSMRPG
jgi:ABC-type branched-subunit amino acid transport system ATPase component